MITFDYISLKIICKPFKDLIIPCDLEKISRFWNISSHIYDSILNQPKQHKKCLNLVWTSQNLITIVYMSYNDKLASCTQKYEKQFILKLQILTLKWIHECCPRIS